MGHASSSTLMRIVLGQRDSGESRFPSHIFFFSSLIEFYWYNVFFSVSAAICLLKKLLEPDPNKRPNIHQVMADSWLQLANKNTGAPYLNR